MFPHIDPGGLLTGLVSATLFTFAIVYVVRSRRAANEIETPITEVLEGDIAPWTEGLFSSVAVEPRLPARGLILSVALHIVALSAAPAFPFLFPAKIHFSLKKFNVKVIEFRVPRPAVYAERAQTGLRPARQIRRPSPAGAARPAGNETAATQRIRRPQFELPASARTRSPEVVIQPDLPLDLHVTLPQPLPRTFLWAQAPAPPEESRLVGSAPNRPPALRSFSVPRVTPKVQLPNVELAIGELQIANGSQLTFRPPQLPLPPTNVSPVGSTLPQVETLGDLPATPLPPGTPMNLVAMTRQLAPLLDAYLLDQGNRLPEPAPAPLGGPAPEAGPGTAGASPGQLRGNLTDLLTGVPAAGAAPAPEARTGETAGLRPAPTDNLGIIVVQATAQEAGLEGSDALSGQPVYTVYLDVPGSTRRWILQYCLPGASATAHVVSSDRVQIVPRRAIQPPFPLERIPIDTRGFGSPGRRLVLYGQVSDQGEIANLRIVRGTGGAIDQIAVATLGRWSFRPARRGDNPVAVEALFGIPLD